jgi:DNA replication protein DnaC
MKEYECEKCKDTGWIVYSDEMNREFARKCECFPMREAKRYMLASGISEEFRSKGFKNFDTFENDQLVNAKQKAIGYFQNFGKTEGTRHNSILFYGQVGSGKTHLGTAISSNLMSRGIAVTYMPYRNAVTKIKQLLTDEGAYTREVLGYCTARVLYIDDFLKGKITESDINIMYEIVNHRYMNNLPMIISTEKSTEELLEFDEAIGSRIIEMCRGNIVQFLGKELNYRLR